MRYCQIPVPVAPFGHIGLPGTRYNQAGGDIRMAAIRGLQFAAKSGRQLARWGIGFALLLLQHAIIAAPNDAGASPDFSDQSPTVQIVVQPVQQHLLGPKPFGGQPSTLFFSLGSIMNDVGFASLGAIIDSSRAFHSPTSEGVMRTDGARSTGNVFDFQRAVLDGVNDLDIEAGWLIADITEYEYSDSKRMLSKGIFRMSDVAYIMYLDFTYFISPELNQLRLIADTFVYARSELSKDVAMLYSRSYEYLSPSQGLVLRKFDVGEKESLIEAIEAQYEHKLERFPMNRKAYSKDRRRALKILKNRDIILPMMAINEGWPGDSVAVGLQTATEHIFQIMRDDLQNIDNVHDEDEEYTSFLCFNRSGKLKKYEGYVLGVLGTNTIYRDEHGNLFSMPDETDTG